MTSSFIVSWSRCQWRSASLTSFATPLARCWNPPLLPETFVSRLMRSTVQSLNISKFLHSVLPFGILIRRLAFTEKRSESMPWFESIWHRGPKISTCIQYSSSYPGDFIVQFEQVEQEWERQESLIFTDTNPRPSLLSASSIRIWYIHVSKLFFLTRSQWI